MTPPPLRVALATCKVLPEPDPDAQPLINALSELGVEPVLAAWDDDSIDWSAFALVVLRSTWNYTLAPARFLTWVRETGAATRLLNPVPVIEANAHKSYLLELAAQDIPVVPTVLRRRGESCEIATVLAERGWEKVVIKPAVSAGSRETLCAARGELDAAQAHFDRLAADEDVLVQAYQESVDDYGERSLVWIDGLLTHSIRKTPRWGGDEESVSGPQPIPADEQGLAERVLAPYEDLLYARVDLARDADGAPQIMELELIEPSLFLLQGGPDPLRRFAEAIVREAKR